MLDYSTSANRYNNVNSQKWQAHSKDFFTYQTLFSLCPVIKCWPSRLQKLKGQYRYFLLLSQVITRDGKQTLSKMAQILADISYERSNGHAM